MKRNTGFTLIELLVVVAIIGILAGIVVPRVATFMAKGRMARAQVEIRGAEMALTKMLTDVDKKDMRQFFSGTGLTAHYETWDLATQIYVCTGISYRLLRMGQDAIIDSERDAATGDVIWRWDNGAALEVRLREDVLKKLGVNYVEELARDPWDNQYLFWFGPWRGATIGGADTAVDLIEFRAFRPGTGDPGSIVPYAYDAAAKAEAEEIVPGAPPVPAAGSEKFGFPAPTKNPVYIFSRGANLEEDQPFLYDGLAADPADTAYQGGGDDINNWDSEAGWTSFYS